MISVIIPTVNRASLLKLALNSLVSQNFPIDSFETLVIDNGSTDNTKDVTQTAIDAHPSHQIRYIYEPEPGLLSGRHRGALEAKGEILIFIDDDIEADPNWLQAIHQSFQDSSVQIVGGRNLPNYEVEPPEWLKWFWSEHPYGRSCPELSLLDFGNEVREIHPDYVWGLNFSIRKSALFELGGFHPDCIPKHLQHFQGDGESGLTRKANLKGYIAIYQPNALVFHSVSKGRMTLEYFDKRYFYQGVCDSYSQIRYEKRQLKQLTIIDQLKIPFKKIRDLLIESLPQRDEKDLLNLRFKRAYTEGYQFHQNAVRQNPQLLNWILKEDYWDYKLPEIQLRGLPA